MNIRYATHLDVGQIVGLCALHAAYEKAAFDPINKEKLLTEYLFLSPGFVKCLVVEQEGEIVGYATFMKQFSTWDAGYFIYMDCLYLNEATRGKGIGKKIMKKISDYAKEESCKTVQWQTPSFNVRAIKFYKNLGANSKSKERFFWDVY